MSIVPQDRYILNSIERTITLGEPYSCITASRIHSIYNVTKDTTIYLFDPSYSISKVGCVIHLNYTGDIDNDDVLTITLFNIEIEEEPVEFELLPSTSSDIVGDPLEVSHYSSVTIHVKAESVTDGATITVQTTIDGVEWATIGVPSENVSKDGIAEISFDTAIHKAIRLVVSDYDDGTYSANAYLGV